jgi:hypothetical protein
MKDWSISIAERPFHLGPIDNFLFGRDAGHSFLRFKDGDGKTFLEIHGVAFDPIKNHRVPNAALDYGVYKSTFAHLFNCKASGAQLKVEALIDPRAMALMVRNSPITETPLLSGSPETITRCVDAAMRAATEINAINLPYHSFGTNLYGQNCHSVTAELVDRMTTACVLPNAMHFAAPGILNDLEKQIPALSAIKPQETGSLSTLFQSLQEDAKKLLHANTASFVETMRNALNMPHAAPV